MGKVDEIKKAYRAKIDAYSGGNVKVFEELSTIGAPGGGYQVPEGIAKRLAQWLNPKAFLNKSGKFQVFDLPETWTNEDEHKALTEHPNAKDLMRDEMLFLAWIRDYRRKKFQPHHDFVRGAKTHEHTDQDS